MISRISSLRVVLATLLLALAGAVLLPWEVGLQSRATNAGFRSVSLNLDLREQIGQSGFLAALSGFRSPLAAFLWIQAHIAWEKTEWGRMAALFNTVTTLQPHTLLYWDVAAWHMAWNASLSSLQDTKQKSEALRERSARQYIALGRHILERGIRNNPNSYELYAALGRLAQFKEEDHAAAASAYAKAASFADAPAYIPRAAAYELAKVPGREKEAYDRLVDLYQKDQGRIAPALLFYIRQLEDKLQIPAEQRMKPPVTKSPSPISGFSK